MVLNIISHPITAILSHSLYFLCAFSVFQLCGFGISLHVMLLGIHALRQVLCLSRKFSVWIVSYITVGAFTSRASEFIFMFSILAAESLEFEC